MKSRLWELVIYSPIVLSLVVAAEGVLVLVAPSVGGPLGETYDALRDAFANDSAAYEDAAVPAILLPAQSATEALPSDEAADSAGLIRLPADADALRPESCAAVHFVASVGIERNYVSFGRFNVVVDTSPFGRYDPVTQWKLLQFGGFPIRTETVEPVHTVSIPVNQAVNLLISDPYTEEMLFSAKWKIESIEVSGRRGSINSSLVPNLSGLGVNNAIDSPALESFSRDGQGVLVMYFEHTADLAPALRAGEPVYAAVTGTMMPLYCAQ
jgi:hypothetical protein